MIIQNSKKSNAKISTLLYFIWCDVKIYLCPKKNSQHIKKMQIYSKNDWNDFKFYEVCIMYQTLWFHLIRISLWAMWKNW